ncbi:hypothetical protein DFH06DRAFT_1468691 [Mycena polygramma]|nr:hypothetical protein DFH06DRAFT_1468691 [Mycena polygramma]
MGCSEYPAQHKNDAKTGPVARALLALAPPPPRLHRTPLRTHAAAASLPTQKKAVPRLLDGRLRTQRLLFLTAAGALLLPRRGPRARHDGHPHSATPPPPHRLTPTDDPDVPLALHASPRLPHRAYLISPLFTPPHTATLRPSSALSAPSPFNARGGGSELEGLVCEGGEGRGGEIACVVRALFALSERLIVILRSRLLLALPLRRPASSLLSSLLACAPWLEHPLAFFVLRSGSLFTVVFPSLASFRGSCFVLDSFAVPAQMPCLFRCLCLVCDTQSPSPMFGRVVSPFGVCHTALRGLPMPHWRKRRRAAAIEGRFPSKLRF